MIPGNKKLNHKLDKKRTILFCHCIYTNLVHDSKRLSIRKALHLQSIHVVDTPDLCGWIAQKNPRLIELINQPLTIFACHSRALKSMLALLDVDMEKKNIRMVNMSTESEENILSQLDVQSKPADKSFQMPVLEKGEWIPWFPVIDRDRCKNCQQCASFCLFGAYSVANGKVHVQNPQNCKTNCPACARICPEAAIIFPKSQESPINGEEITDENMIRANIKVNVDQILGDDVYASLAERRKKAKAMLQDTAFQKAQLERMRFLNPAEK